MAKKKPARRQQRKPDETKKFAAALKMVHKRFGGAMKKLAE